MTFASRESAVSRLGLALGLGLSFAGGCAPADDEAEDQPELDHQAASLSTARSAASADRLVTGEAALRALDAIEAAGLLLISAQAAGGIAGVLDLLVEYLNTRTAFGRRIGSYQGLKHPTVDILVGLERYELLFACLKEPH